MVKTEKSTTRERKRDRFRIEITLWHCSSVLTNWVWTWNNILNQYLGTLTLITNKEKNNKNKLNIRDTSTKHRTEESIAELKAECTYIGSGSISEVVLGLQGRWGASGSHHGVAFTPRWFWLLAAYDKPAPSTSDQLWAKMHKAYSMSHPNTHYCCCSTATSWWILTDTVWRCCPLVAVHTATECYLHTIRIMIDYTRRPYYPCPCRQLPLPIHHTPFACVVCGILSAPCKDMCGSRQDNRISFVGTLVIASIHSIMLSFCLQ